MSVSENSSCIIKKTSWKLAVGRHTFKTLVLFFVKDSISLIEGLFLALVFLNVKHIEKGEVNMRSRVLFETCVLTMRFFLLHNACAAKRWQRSRSFRQFYRLSASLPTAFLFVSAADISTCIRYTCHGHYNHATSCELFSIFHQVYGTAAAKTDTTVRAWNVLCGERLILTNMATIINTKVTGVRKQKPSLPSEAVAHLHFSSVTSGQRPQWLL